jgi:hypothetical protein
LRPFVIFVFNSCFGQEKGHVNRQSDRNDCLDGKG